MNEQFTVTNEDGNIRLDVFLKKHVAVLSREKVKKGILSGNASIDGKTCDDPSFKVRASQTIDFSFEIESGLKPYEFQLKKVFEDDDFLVISKPPGLVVHPGAGTKHDTLVNVLIAQYPNLVNVGERFRPGIVHRLDKDTSGLLLVAKNKESFDYAKQLFTSREIRKEYVALVVGRVIGPHGFIEKSLAPSYKGRKVKVSSEGREAKTEYNVLGYYSDGIDDYTLIRVILHTGRTHQIRVLFSSIGHPVAGDDTYGAGSPNPAGLSRQFLHAKRLMFKLPSGTTLDVEDELPDDLQEVLNNLIKI